MNIVQPMTMLTDYILAAVCVVVSVKLLRQRPSERPAQLWGIAFLFVALSALTGGTWHGFEAHFGGQTLTVLWKSTIYAVGVFDLLLVAGSILATVAISVS